MLLEDDLDKTEYEWDTTTTPAGMYQLKVVASDRKDNPEGEALVGRADGRPGDGGPRAAGGDTSHFRR